MENIINGARSSLDFAQLGELKGRAQRREDSALRETAQQFEAMFLYSYPVKMSRFKS